MPLAIDPGAMDEELFAVGEVDALNPEELITVGVAVTPLSDGAIEGGRRGVGWGFIGDACRALGLTWRRCRWCGGRGDAEVLVDSTCGVFEGPVSGAHEEGDTGDAAAGLGATAALVAVTTAVAVAVVPAEAVLATAEGAGAVTVLEEIGMNATDGGEDVEPAPVGSVEGALGRHQAVAVSEGAAMARAMRTRTKAERERSVAAA